MATDNLGSIVSLGNVLRIDNAVIDEVFSQITTPDISLSPIPSHGRAELPRQTSCSLT